MELYCLMNTKDKSILTCQGFWQEMLQEKTALRPILFLSKTDAVAYVAEVLFLEGCNIQPIPW